MRWCASRTSRCVRSAPTSPTCSAAPVEDVLGRHLSALIGAEQAARIEQAASTFGELRQRNPIECVIEVAGEPRAFDAILRREPGGVLLVELEIAYGERPFSFPNTYQAVRGSVEELNRAATLTELYDTAARAVRDLTGFDRVMVYRYDERLQRRGGRRVQARGPQLVPRPALPVHRHSGAGAGAVREELDPAHLGRRLHARRRWCRPSTRRAARRWT